MEEHGYPLHLTTEASIDLAEDPELLEMMYRANFRSVFIGIETPRIDSLNETKKYQNVRGDSLGAKLAADPSRAGIDINAGFIVGFDSDDKGIFEDQFRFIQENGITLAMVGMLQAIPKTPLYDRLKRDGRLVEEDPSCNFVPKQMTRDELRTKATGTWSNGCTRPKRTSNATSRSTNRRVPGRRADDLPQGRRGQTTADAGVWPGLMWSLFFALLKDGCAILGWLGVREVFLHGRAALSPRIIGFAQFMNRCVTHWHFYKFTRELIAGHVAGVQYALKRAPRQGIAGERYFSSLRFLRFSSSISLRNAAHSAVGESTVAPVARSFVRTITSFRNAFDFFCLGVGHGELSMGLAGVVPCRIGRLPSDDFEPPLQVGPFAR